MTNEERIALNEEMASGLISDLCVDGVDRMDCPDFCDAYFSAGSRLEHGVWRELTEGELEVLTEDWGCRLNEMAHESLR